MLPQAPENLVLPAGAPARRGRPGPAGILLLIASILTLATAAYGSQPIEALRKSIDDGLHILNDPYYLPPDRKSVQQLQLRQLLYRDFDFTEFSKRVLADKWALFTAPQRTEFVEVFSRFLADHYLARLQAQYRNEKVVLHRQDFIAHSRAVVRAGVIWRSREVPVEIRMLARGGNWRVYDVAVIGISAVQIYRAQLQEIMRTRSPAQVIELIKQRLEE
jgi:phospholipid transport system substrate-binding protein